MGDAAEKLSRRATWADLEAVPTHLVAEIIDGTLYTSPRPAPRHAQAAWALGGEFYGAGSPGARGPAGWRILPEPELRFGPEKQEAMVPDLAGWRLERMPALPQQAFITLAPDWVCEILSPSTVRFDRTKKMPTYAREGVRHAWLLDPITRTLEVYTLGADGRWILAGVQDDGEGPVRAEPFEALELDLTVLWSE